MSKERSPFILAASIARLIDFQDTSVKGQEDAVVLGRPFYINFLPFLIVK